ncbi:hypothetical protein F4809DRAFT_638993 [Biscogniauxia mediterranea]|nr:hypothetical protein F4809DRAFT_638993 [Biscogniauxia mediterranea]
MSRLQRNIYNLDQPGLLASENQDPGSGSITSHTILLHPLDQPFFCDAGNRIEDNVSVGGVAKVDKFFRGKFLYWLEALRLMQQIWDDATFLITKLENLLRGKSSDHDLLELVHDARWFIHDNIDAIRTAPLQTYSSTLIFSPVKSLIQRLFQKEEPEWNEDKAHSGRYLESLFASDP